MTWSAPSAFSCSSFASLDEVAMTTAPIAFANCSAKMDTPPEPCTRTDCPANVGPSGTIARHAVTPAQVSRSEEHTSELQSLMRISYAVFCLKQKKKHHQKTDKK